MIRNRLGQSKSARRERRFALRALLLAIAITIPSLGIRPSLAEPGVSAPLTKSTQDRVRNPCPPLQTLPIKTGCDYATGTTSKIGGPDLNWTVVADPDPNTTESRPPYVITQNPAWAAPLPGTQWISSYSTASDEMNGKYVFELCFCLREGFSNPILNLSLRADDRAEVFLNGGSLGSTPNPSFNTLAPYQVPVPPSNVFKVGRNCIRVVVENVYSVAMGLNLSGSITTNGLGLDNPQCCNPNSQIAGTKWNDLNGNGIRDNGEPGLPGWTITLSNGMTAVTDSHGNYYFTNLTPGTYTVGEANQSGWSQTFPGGGGSHTINLGVHQVIDGQNFGNSHPFGPACCREAKLDISLPKPIYDFCAPNHGYLLAPKFYVSGLGNIVQITADILSASVSYSPTSCGTGGAVAGSFASPTSENGFSAALATPPSELVWTATNASGVAFPLTGLQFNQIKILLPGPPTNARCNYILKFCMKVTYTDNRCRTCSVIKCFSFDLKGMPPPNPSPC